jgi:hypothetical protein
MLRDACDAVQVRWALDCAVHGVEHHPDVEHKRYTLRTANGTFSCQSLVVATGGLAIPQIGASPFGYKLAEQFGIPVIAPKPALVPLALGPELLAPLKPMAGATLDATACFEDAAFRENVLITHRGLSGPAILQISSYWQMQEYRSGKKQPVEIDLLPGLDASAWLKNTGRAGASPNASRACPALRPRMVHAGGDKFVTRPIANSVAAISR